MQFTAREKSLKTSNYKTYSGKLKKEGCYSLLQKPFNDVTYELIGDDAAQNYFRVDAVTGAITVGNNNLATDGTRQYSLRVRASDGGEPPRSTVTVVTVGTLRNLVAPRFGQSAYEVEDVKETLAVGEVIATVTATDDDLRVRVAIT